MMAIPPGWTKKYIVPNQFWRAYSTGKRRALIVDDLISMNGAVLHHQNAYDRIQRSTIWSTISTDRICISPHENGSKKVFRLPQLAECLDWRKSRLPFYRCFDQTRRDDQERNDSTLHVWVQWSVSSRKRTDPATTWSLKGRTWSINALNNSTAPLVVKTLKDSLLLTKMFKVHQITRFVWISLPGKVLHSMISNFFLGSDVLSGFLFIHNIAISPEGHDVTS
jgi:hypothetical protein